VYSAPCPSLWIRSRSRKSGRTDVERSVGAREDVHEAGSRDRRWRLALRLPIRSCGLGRSLGVAQGHSPRPVRPVSLARTSRMACHERGPHIARAESNGGSAWESNPAPPQSGERPILKTGRATGPRSLPERSYHPTSVCRTLPPWMASRTSMNMECERTTPPPPNGREWKRQKQSGPGPLDSSSGAGCGWRTSSLRLVESHQPADPLRTLPA
jgi:hypothetical protein